MAILPLDDRRRQDDAGITRTGQIRDGAGRLEHLEVPVMGMIIFLVSVFVLLDIAALKGWAPDTRDARDWTVPNTSPSHSGVVRLR